MFLLSRLFSKVKKNIRSASFQDAGTSFKNHTIISLLYDNILDIHLGWFMVGRGQICTDYSPKVKGNVILICCMCECVCTWLCVCLCVLSRTQTSSGERKCEQVNPLLAGLQHHMEISRPLVSLDTRYHLDWAWWAIGGCLLWESDDTVKPGSMEWNEEMAGWLNVSNLYSSVMYTADVKPWLEVWFVVSFHAWLNYLQTDLMFCLKCFLAFCLCEWVECWG